MLRVGLAALAALPVVAAAPCDGTIFAYWGKDGETQVEFFVLYFLLMTYFFGGVAVVADIFMASIEQITSVTKTITRGDTTIEVVVWNKTVANLSLMALGSSAPEILLAIVEVVGRGFEAGELGPGTIVGSAAFNMLMILAICVSIDGSKRVEQINVLYITASFSVFAYVWLYLIVSVISPGRVEVWEAVVTILYFPILLVIAWAADNGWIDKKKIVKPVVKPFRSMRKTIRRRLSDSYALRESKRAEEANAALEHLVSVGRLSVAPQHSSVWHRKLKKTIKAVRKKKPELSKEDVYIEAFETLKGHHRLRKSISARSHGAAHTNGASGTVTVASTIASADAAASGPMVQTAFPSDPALPSETLDVVEIAEFDLDDVQAHHSAPATGNGTGNGSTNSTGHGNGNGNGNGYGNAGSPSDDCALTFGSTMVRCDKNQGKLRLPVLRKGSNIGDVRLSFETVDGTALAGTHYHARQGILLFPSSEVQQMLEIEIDIVDVAGYDQNKFFSVILDCDEDIAWEFQECSIEIEETYAFTGALDRALKTTAKFFRQIVRDEEADSAYAEQIRVAFRYEDEESDDDDDEDGEGEGDGEGDDGVRAAGEPGSGAVVAATPPAAAAPAAGALGPHESSGKLVPRAGEEGPQRRSVLERFTYWFLVVWKVLFAVLIPPVTWCTGYVTFVFTLAYIGVLTAFIGDFATGLGCSIGLQDAVTAITFVALGTSVPDTFASKIAAEEDPTADPAIGNVTGSNAVNVFLGVGLSWLFGSVKHHIDGTDFLVEQGTIGFAVLTFSIFAVAWFAVLMIRRNWSEIGCELGGPPFYKKLTAGFFVFLWLVYILLSSLVAYDHIPSI